MNWLIDLFTGTGVAHSIVLLAIAIFLGLLLGRIKIANVSLGITWILFVGIALSHFGLQVNAPLLDFIKEFGLILFVYAIGLQVGPGFFSSLRKGGLKLNLFAAGIVLFGAATTYVIHLISHTDLPTMVGIMSGAVTNTPGLGAAQQALTDIPGSDPARLTMGYAVTYPFGVLSIIFSTIALKYICRVNLNHEKGEQEQAAQHDAQPASIVIENPAIIGFTLEELHNYYPKPFVAPRIRSREGEVEATNRKTVLSEGHILNVVAERSQIPEMIELIGRAEELNEMEWERHTQHLVSRRLVVTRRDVNGKRIADMHVRSLYGVNITRVHRAGIELLATPGLTLQMGDRVTVVGDEPHIQKLADALGNSLKRLDQPNLVPIFLGIALGVVLGSIPIALPFLPLPVKLGLAGGPLIVALLMARYGPYYKIVTFTTTSASMMLREVGISLFLAAVGLSAGENFVETILREGYIWIFYGIAITIIPIFVVGLVARLIFKVDYPTLMGLIAGSNTDPPALAFANGVANNDAPSVAYATVYPLTMFLRVMVAQVMVLF